MISTALSISMTGDAHRSKSYRNKARRSRSQPPTENRYGFLPPISPQGARPMKSFFENILHLKPYGSLSTSGAMENRAKISSSFVATLPSDRSSHLRIGHPSVISNYSMRSTNVHSPHEAQPLPTKLTSKFRRAGELILFAIYWCEFARKKNQLRSMAYQSYLQTNDTTDKCMFDKSNFKIQTTEILPLVQEFFKQPPDERDLDNADQVRRCLADVKPFSRLPKVLQDKLLQKAWYECYPERRTIVRQDERPAYYYIILSGSAIPTYKRGAEGNVETLDVLKRGSTFGDKSLLTDSAQNWTVTSKTKLELLVLWKTDFKSIFGTRDRHCSKDDLRYLKNHIAFLRGFPIDRLYDIPNGIQHLHFGPSEIIARDSRRMKHIFIVKKGSLDIWKRLDPTDDDRNYRKDNEITIDNEDELTGDSRALFSDIQLGGGDSSGSFTNALDAEVRPSHSGNGDRRASSTLSTRSRSIIIEDKKFPGLIDKRDRIQLIDYEALSINSTGTKLTLTNALLKQNQITVKESVKRKLIHPDKRIYVHVKTLNKGQHFGLTDMLFPNQPGLTVISNGCECYLLDKSAFTQLATDQYKKIVRRTETPFPMDNVFDEKYHQNELWKRYSRGVYVKTLRRLSQQRPEDLNLSMNTEEPQSYQRRQSILLDAV